MTHERNVKGLLGTKLGMTQVWDERWVGQTKTLDVHIAALRRKVQSARGDGRIVTVRGQGYTYEKAR